MVNQRYALANSRSTPLFGVVMLMTSCAFLDQTRVPTLLPAACFCRRRYFRYPLDGCFAFTLGVMDFLSAIPGSSSLVACSGHAACMPCCLDLSISGAYSPVISANDRVFNAKGPPSGRPFCDLVYIVWCTDRTVQPKATPLPSLPRRRMSVLPGRHKVPPGCDWPGGVCPEYGLHESVRSAR